MAAAVLAARDAREALVGRVLACARGEAAVIWMSAGVPGADKQPPGIDRVFERAATVVGASAVNAEVAAAGADVLGPYRAVVASGDPTRLKRSMVDLEGTLHAGRLLDLDVYDSSGRLVDRASLGLPQRTCLACAEPARACIRRATHSPETLASAVAELLAPFVSEPPPLSPDALASALTGGAMAELELTPKPGLVDRLDNGSHPDLSFELMARSIALLPPYYDELLALRRRRAPLAACVGAGLRAERRMFEATGTNTHRGYIFLSGLLLLAACDLEPADNGRTGVDPVAVTTDLRIRVRMIAREFFDRGSPATSSVPSGGRQSRAPGSAGGVRTEALDGLPAVFEVGLPSFTRWLERAGARVLASHALLGVLMQRVEDTTALRRCGQAGLARLARDGAALERLIAVGGNPLPALRRWNDDYRRMRLTMGGVADCMALVFAVHAWTAPQTRSGAL